MVVLVQVFIAAHLELAPAVQVPLLYLVWQSAWVVPGKSVQF